MMPAVQPDEEEASGSSAASSPVASTPSPSKNKVHSSELEKSILHRAVFMLRRLHRVFDRVRFCARAARFENLRMLK